MYMAYDVQNVNALDKIYSKYSTEINSYVNERKEETKQRTDNFFKTYTFKGDYIDADKIMKNLFKGDAYHVFISHSSSDSKYADTMSYILNKCKINAFVDSHVWGYMNDLLKKIDIKYCKNDDGSYDYEKRNITTSHVHMMLSASLQRMIDICECFLFLNTQNSIESALEKSVTSSPWIMSEILMASLIVRKKMRQRPIFEASESLAKDTSLPKIYYYVPIDKLITIQCNDLLDIIFYDKYTKFELLDEIYKKFQENNLQRIYD